MNYRPDPLTRIIARAGRAIMSAPTPLLRLVARPGRNGRGYLLDPDVAMSLALLKVIGSGKGIGELSVAEARREIDREAYLAAGPRPKVRTRDERIAGVAVRRYFGFPLADASAPAVMYLHGGGWAVGSLDSHDAPCLRLAEAAGVDVISVDYRLAPEHPFPAGLDDVMAVYEELTGPRPGAASGPDGAASPSGDRAASRRVAVIGDSAGANFAAVVCLEAKRRGLPQPALQGLLAPVTDMLAWVGDRDGWTGSGREFADGYFLTSADMSAYADLYIGDGAPGSASTQLAQDPRVSPLFAEDLSGLAPAFVALGGFDPLRDEGEAYAARLADAGVPVTVKIHRGMVHPFINSPGLWRTSRRAIDELAGAVRLALEVRQ
ncbi:alpha/beta hydrolase [Corynebacterium freneyi]|uniref:Acetyl esterase n=1 Tax=Corynebacterium freneyi TaxID=134034 RepID=A0ABS4U728_9CORY|nr:alpha/beta hydrolase [Corynebacterium freneyi]MBP2332459.1 acetyl esterase [Corynebacterium freneyi]QXA53355.1 alpha/beta hydrolase [Corynebacterium freneyi]WJZ05435.1 Carboxylesterase NlhH [Corynebacterium freneyi]